MNIRGIALAALVASCGGSQKTAGNAPAHEDFGPGLVTHEGAVDALTRDAQRVLASQFTVAPGDAPGMVTTEWAEHDKTRWPGTRTRVVAEITASKVIVRIQCQAERGSCAASIPEGIDLITLAQELAGEIAGESVADPILAKMRAFKDDVCACTDASCIENVEKRMMEWAMKNMDMFKNMKPTRAQDEEADRIEDAMDACKQRIAPETSYSHSHSSNTQVTPIPPGGTGSPACDQYLATFDEVMGKCKDKLGPAYDAMLQSRNAQLDAFVSWKTLDKASLKATIEAAETGCKSATDAIRMSAEAMGCTL